MTQSPPPILPSPTDTFTAMESEIRETVCPTTVPMLHTFDQQEDDEHLTLMSEEIVSHIHSKIGAKVPPFRTTREQTAFLPMIEDCDAWLEYEAASNTLDDSITTTTTTDSCNHDDDDDGDMSLFV